MDVKDNPFLDFLDLATTGDGLSEGFKQESSGLVTGDTASLSLGTIGKGAYVTDPLVLSFPGMLVHLRDISNLGVICDAISMS